MAENIKVLVLSERDDIVAIADAVRNKTGSTDEMTLSEIVTGINSITGTGGGADIADATATADEIFKDKTAYVANGKVTGTFTIDDELTEQNELISQISTLVATKAMPPSTDTNDATATAEDILSGKTAYIKGQKVIGTIPTVTQATPSIEVSSSGLITATSTQSEGYINAGTKSGTKQLTTKTTTTYTPTTSNQTIPSGTYLTGNQTIVGDANLVAENIKSGVSIFGVAGNYEGSGSSSGGSFETANVVIDFLAGMQSPGSGMGTLVYTSSSGEVISTSYDATSSGGFSFVAAKSTLCTFSAVEMPSATSITGGTLVFAGMSQVVCSLDDSSVSIKIN